MAVMLVLGGQSPNPNDAVEMAVNGAGRLLRQMMR